MAWLVEFEQTFDVEVDAVPGAVRRELIARAGVLSEFGPTLGRPSVDTLKGSRHTTMKELRFRADGGAWRVAFAFDPERRAILLVAGDKRGQDQRRFYERLISTADRRYDTHLERLRAARKRS